MHMYRMIHDLSTPCVTFPFTGRCKVVDHPVLYIRTRTRIYIAPYSDIPFLDITSSQIYILLVDIKPTEIFNPYYALISLYCFSKKATCRGDVVYNNYSVLK